MSPNKYETSHICAAVVACVAIVCVVVVVISSVVLLWVERTTFKTDGTTADWILAVCAVVGVVTSLIGLGLLVSTLSANRAMVVSTDRSVKLVAAFNKTQLRPWIAIDFDSAKFSDQPDGSGKLEIKIKNVGLSSANNVLLRVEEFPCTKSNTYRALVKVREFSEHTVELLGHQAGMASVMPTQELFVDAEVKPNQEAFLTSENFAEMLVNRTLLVCVAYKGNHSVWEEETFFTACCLWRYSASRKETLELIAGTNLSY